MEGEGIVIIIWNRKTKVLWTLFTPPVSFFFLLLRVNIRDQNSEKFFLKVQYTINTRKVCLQCEVFKRFCHIVVICFCYNFSGGIKPPCQLSPPLLPITYC